MRIVSEEQIIRLQEMLDEKYDICISFNNNADNVAYKAELRTIEYLGFDWERENGKHTIHGNYAN